MGINRVWIIGTGEPLPTDPGPPRLLRAGMIAQRMAQRGNDVTWFTSAFNHQRKIMRPVTRGTVAAGSASMQVVTLPALGYEGHVSIARLRDHRTTARAFRTLASTLPRPEVICTSFPTIELALASTNHALAVGARSVLDVRDLWPDIFYDRVPHLLRTLSRAPLAPLERATNRAFREASSIVGISEDFLAWGLRRAGRPRSTFDCVFPLAYEAPPSNPESAEDAATFWSALGVTKERLVCCFIGSLTDSFDFDHISEAAALPENEHRLFVIAGDGPLRARLEVAAPPNLILPGFVDAHCARELLRRSRAALAPYLQRHDREGAISNKVIEYLGAGLPVLTTLHVGETARLVRDESVGLVYEPTANSLTAALARIDGADSSGFSLRAGRVFADRFLAEKVYGDYCDLLEQLARSTAGI